MRRNSQALRVFDHNVDADLSFPRVLVISPVKFNQQTGSGVTMGNLFRGWPLDAIAQVHSENWTEPDLTICQRYYHLPYESIRRPSTSSMMKGALRQTSRFLNHKQLTLFGHFAHTENLLAWVKEFAPDVIYARPLDRPSFSIWLPSWLSKQLCIPYITRFLDDWPARHEHDPVWIRRFFWHLFIRRKLTHLLDYAAINVGISDEMCFAFQKRYRSSFLPFHNCVDFDSWVPEKTDYTAKDPFEIVYMGTVKADKELQSLQDLSAVLLNLSGQGYHIQFTLYGPEIYEQMISRYLKVEPVIKYGGFFPAEEKFEILKKADLLVLPLNFDQQSTTYLGYSFQTKVPEYMASGTPVLVYGPAENPNVRYATLLQWAMVIDQQEKDRLTSVLKQIIANQNLREQLGRRARKLALQNHDATIIRPRFQQLIRNIAARKPII